MTRSPSGIPSQSHLDHATTVILLPHAEVHRRHPTKVTFCVRGVISPLLANLYLHPLDLLMEASGHRMVRGACPRAGRRPDPWADDFVILCRSEDEALAAL